MDAQVGTIGTAETGRASGGPGPVLCLVILLLVTLFSRANEFNNPLGHVDDQFYLFTGKAMLHGALPYVDVWDRKPIGLFLIYAGIAALGGNGVIVYHLVAGLAALATAAVVTILARRFTTSGGALAAGIVYLLLLPTLGGAGGQAPVFYNLLIAIAALLTYNAFVRHDKRWPGALWAMLMVGVAIQIKPTTLFEGAFFGLLFLVAEWRASRRPAVIVPLAGAMLVTALAPTALAFGIYAIFGHADEMWFATVVSIFLRTPLALGERLGNVPELIVYLTVPTLVALGALSIDRRKHGWTEHNLFLAGWCAAALIGFLSVPNFFNHYALPLFLPLSVTMASLLGDRRDGLIFSAMVMAIPVILVTPAPVAIAHNAEGFERTAEFVKSKLHGGCLYVFLGPTQLYTATDACHLSPYVFPDHLESKVEGTALPVDPEVEVERIFAQRPAVVTTIPRRFLKRNNRTAAIVERHLSCDYALARRVPVNVGLFLDIWTRRPGTRSCPATHPPLGIVQPADD